MPAFCVFYSSNRIRYSFTGFLPKWWKFIYSGPEYIECFQFESCELFVCKLYFFMISKYFYVYCHRPKEYIITTFHRPPQTIVVYVVGYSWPLLALPCWLASQINYIGLCTLGPQNSKMCNVSNVWCNLKINACSVSVCPSVPNYANESMPIWLRFICLFYLCGSVFKFKLHCAGVLLIVCDQH